MNYMYFELHTTGANPLFSRISELNVLLCEDGSMRAESMKSSSLLEELKLLKDFSELAGDFEAIAFPDEVKIKYMKDCFKQYFMKEPDAFSNFVYPEIDVKTESYTGELKHFYTKWKDYYYFPAEDVAYHKSIAKFADKSARVKATPETAYTKKAGTFVPAYNSDPENLFKKSFDSKETFVPIEKADASASLHSVLLRMLS